MTELPQAYGIVQNVILKLHQEHMISISKKSKVKIVISFYENSPQSERFSNESKLTADSLYSALEPDIEYSLCTGVGMSINTHLSEVIIRIATDDIPSLRASINSYLRHVNTAIDVIKYSS